MDQLIGQTIGRYRIVSLLGEGGMGAVYKALDVTLEREVAFKVMHAQFARQTNFQERFLQEARTAARFNHPSIVKVYDFGQNQGTLFIVMEFIPGDNLGKMLQSLRSHRQWILLPEAISLFNQICLALDYIHRQGITHRDIKPDNIMLRPEPGSDLPYCPVLTDLGLAKLAEGGVFTQDGTSMGTPAYMSPEQALGKPTDKRSDVYSLGILLFELAVGCLPFTAKTLTEAIRCHTQERPPDPLSIRPELPMALRDTILKAIEKNPADRFQTAGDLAKSLSECLPALRTAPQAPAVDQAGISLATQVQQSVVEMRGPSLLQAFAAPASDISQDRIQIYEPDHTGRSIPISGKTIGIGREADNAIVLFDPRVSHHHARLDFNGSQYQVIDLGSTNGTYLANTRLLPGVPEIWSSDKTLRVGDAYLRLVTARKVTPTGSGGPSALSVDPQLVQSSPGRGQVGIFLAERQFSTDPGSALITTVIVLNQGDIVDHFELSISGIPANWIPSLPHPVQLLPGEQQSVNFTILPPRSPKSRAGRYPLNLRISGVSAPDQAAQVNATLDVLPFFSFTSDLHPSRIKANKASRVSINNKGNVKQSYDLVWKDPADDLVFNPPRTSLAVGEGQTQVVEFRASPRQRRWFGSEQSFPFGVQVASQNGETQAQNGEILSRGLIPPWVIPLLLVVCLVLGGGTAMVYKQITDRAATATAQYSMTMYAIITEAVQTPVLPTFPVSPVITQETETITPSSEVPTTPPPTLVAVTVTPTPAPIAINPVTIERINMVNESDGWAVGMTSSSTSDQILFTRDGGESWKIITPHHAFDSIGSDNKSAVAYFSNREKAWVFYFNSDNSLPGTTSVVTWKTTDGGQNWTASQAFDITGLQLGFFKPSDIGFSDDSHGWALIHLDSGMMHDYVTVFTTGDGGQTWQKIVDPTGSSLSQSCDKSGITFSDANTGWVTGDCSGVVPGVYFYRTTNGGSTWENQSLPAPPEMPNAFSDGAIACKSEPPYFVDNTVGFALISCSDANTPGGTKTSWIYKTENGGEGWTALPVLSGSATVLYFQDRSLGWLGGLYSPDTSFPSYVSQTTDGGMSWVIRGGLDWVNQIDFISAQNGWAVTEAVIINLMKTTDGGWTWQKITPMVLIYK